MSERTQQQRELEQWSDTVADAIVESRLRRNYLSRLTRWIMTLAFAVFIAVVVTDARVVGAERDGCERRQQIFRSIDNILADVVDGQRKEFEVETVPKEKAVEKERLDTLELNQNLIRANIVSHCNEAYPHILPFTEWIE